MSEIQPVQTAEIQRLVADAIDYARQSRAPATLKAYQSDWRLFEQFCGSHGLETLPAAPSTVVLFITKLAETHRPSSIQRKLAAISVAHKSAGASSPIAREVVRTTMAGVKRAKGMAKAQKAPIRARHLREGLPHMRSDLKGIRDTAIVLLAYAGALRRSEVVGLNMADVSLLLRVSYLSSLEARLTRMGAVSRLPSRQETVPIPAR